jgi:molybdopterin synthase sulfur carrier subunit
MMKLQLRFFASLREGLGLSEELVSVPASVVNIAELRAWLMQRGEVWAQLLSSERSLSCAVNQHIAAENLALSDGDEVAFFPPVTGG